MKRISAGHRVDVARRPPSMAPNGAASRTVNSSSARVRGIPERSVTPCRGPPPAEAGGGFLFLDGTRYLIPQDQLPPCVVLEILQWGRIF